MNSKMTTNSQLLTTKPKKPKTKTKQTRTGTESQKWRSHGGLSEEEWERERGGKVQRRSSINGRQKIDREGGKNTIGNGEAKELRCMTHGHELRGVEGNKREKEMGPL